MTTTTISTITPAVNTLTRTYDKEEYQREYNILKSFVSEDVYSLLQDLDVIVAGGTLTSLFSNREVNDLDLYFKSWDHLETFLAYVFDPELMKNSHDLSSKTKGWNDIKRAFRRFKALDGVDLDSYIPLKICKGNLSNSLNLSAKSLAPLYKTTLHSSGMTDKSIMFSNLNGPTVQLIGFNVFADADAIFKKFDYTINMGAFNFKDESWSLHRDFLKHIAQKVLVVNPSTDYPIISLLRASKYEARGYTISRRETMKLGIACSNLRLKSWKDAKDHLSGMYGTNVEKLFNEEKPFSFDGLFDKLDNAGDKILSQIATERDKELNNFDLEPVGFFEAVHRLRVSTGRAHYKDLWAVCSAARFYILDKTRSRVVHLGMTNKDKGFKDYVSLFFDEHSARSFYKDGKKKDGFWNAETEGVLMKATVVQPAKLLQESHDSAKGPEEDVVIVLNEFIESNGEII